MIMVSRRGGGNVTLKEKVAEMMPNKISKRFIAGVCGCPCDYNFLPESKMGFCGCPENEDGEIMSCHECWNREYDGLEEEAK